MKYLKSFTDIFINESNSNMFQEIKLLELVESLERDCKDFITLCRKFDFDLEENKNSFLFRSSDYFSDYVIVDTNKSNSLRKAPFTVTNWHNLIYLI